MKTTLLILAAGMGSRYGGLKQLDSIDEAGHTLLEYSIYDAIEAGFDSFVFVIRKAFEVEFRAKVASKLDPSLSIEYAFQSIDDLPKGFDCPEVRKKPWGTAQAVWSARQIVKNPFVVINADDFYGREAFTLMHQFCQKMGSNQDSELASGIVTYALKNTLSEHGAVNRGICCIEKKHLSSIEEYTDIAQAPNDSIVGTNSKGQDLGLSEDSPVSMNFWGFSPNIFPLIESYFKEFLQEHLQNPNSECYLPSAIDHFIQEKRLTCETLKTKATWLGVTYPEDKQKIQEALTAIKQTESYFN